MARVEIEDRAFSDPRLKRLAILAGISRAHAIGILATLWHDSQTEVKITATAEDLSIWFAPEISAGIAVTEVLLASGYIERVSAGFRVLGNEERCQQLLGYQRRARQAAEKRWGSRQAKQTADATSMPQACYKHATSMPQASKPRVIPKQKKTSKDKDHDTQSVIAAFSDAFKGKFGHPPVISGKEVGAAKNLVTTLGADAACKMVEAYLHVEDRWFMTRGYDLATLVSNLNKVKTFMETGVTITGTIAAQAELSSSNRQAVRQFLDNYERGNHATAPF